MKMVPRIMSLTCGVDYTPSFFQLGLNPFFFMYTILLSLNGSRKTTKILWAILWPSFYSFVSMAIPSWSSGTTNSVSLGCRNLIRTKFLSWLLLFSPSLINRIMWMKWQLENMAKVKYEGNLSVSLTLLGLRFSLWLHTKQYSVPNEKAVIFSGTQAWSSSGCWAGNAVAWQHRVSAATVSAWIILMSSTNISKFSPSAPKFEKIYFSRNKLTTEVCARMKTISRRKIRDYEQVKLPEYVRSLVFPSHVGIEYHNYFDPVQGSPER